MSIAEVALGLLGRAHEVLLNAGAGDVLASFQDIFTAFSQGRVSESGLTAAVQKLVRDYPEVGQGSSVPAMAAPPLEPPDLDLDGEEEEVEEEESEPEPKPKPRKRRRVPQPPPPLSRRPPSRDGRAPSRGAGADGRAPSRGAGGEGPRAPVTQLRPPRPRFQRQPQSAEPAPGARVRVQAVPPHLLCDTVYGKGLGSQLKLQFCMAPRLTVTAALPDATTDDELLGTVTDLYTTSMVQFHKVATQVVAANRKAIVAQQRALRDFRAAAPKEPVFPRQGDLFPMVDTKLPQAPLPRNLPNSVKRVVTTVAPSKLAPTIRSIADTAFGRRKAGGVPDDAYPFRLLDGMLSGRLLGEEPQVLPLTAADGEAEPFDILDVALEATGLSTAPPRAPPPPTIMLPAASVLESPRTAHVSVIVKVRPTVLPLVTPLPKYTTWIPLNRTVYAEDDTVLRFVPYFGDKDQEGVDLSAYESVAHGQVLQCLQNPVVEQVIAATMGKHGASERSCSMLAQLFQPPGTGAVDDEEAMPGEKLTADDVMGRWKAIQQRARVLESHVQLKSARKRISQLNCLLNKTVPLRTPSAVTKALSRPQSAVSSNYQKFGPKCLGIRVRNIPGSTVPKFSEIAESYVLLFCRRCFVYDCRKHGAAHPQPVSLSDREVPKLPPSLETCLPKGDRDPCGKQCHLLEPGGDHDADVPTPTPLESALLDKLAKVALQPTRSGSLPPHRVPCYVCRVIQTLSCAQVARLQPPPVANGGGAGAQPVTAPSRMSMVNARKHAGTAVYDKSLKVPFVACNHPGKCTPEVCPCARHGKFCEKFCGCAGDCALQYPGCRCKGKCRGLSCLCVKAMRECDADVCSCGALKALTAPEPVEGNPFGSHTDECGNIMTQLGQHSAVSVGRSTIHGWGLFALTTIHKNDFVQEYKGELISQDEADRRGHIYDKLNCSFLFNLNDDWVIDSTRKGSKTKYVNHSNSPNCFAKVVSVNGDHKIGLYAKQDIAPGEELTFDYQYNEQHEKEHLTRRG